jgi:short-subunit dehydrogenase
VANLIIFGASRGLGSAFSAGLPARGDIAWLVSRGRPETLDRDDGVTRRWVQADLSAPKEAAKTIGEALAGRPLDVLVYNAGIWEERAFESDYRFEEVPDDEHIRIITVNLTSAILCIQKLLPNLRQADNAKIILIGSTSGLENIGAPEVAYGASKFGLRGIAHALREGLRTEGMAVTVLNPGTIAATLAYDDGPEAALARYDGMQIPVHDLVAIVKCLMGLSKASCVKEIDIPAMADLTA